MRKPQKPVEALDAVQAHEVGVYLRGHHKRFGALYQLIFLAGCNLGLRAYDLLRLRVGLFDAGKGGVIESKTKKERYVVINKTLRRLYAEYRTDQKIILWAQNAYIAASTRGACIETKYIHWLIADACAALEYPGNYGSHTMRKTFAREIYRKTGSVTIVRELLQHTNPEVTYLYLDDDTAHEDTEPPPAYTLSELYNLVGFE
jgi:integrase